MARKDALKKMKDVLITRRKALRLALDGDFSLLQQIQQEASGDIADFALDAAHDEISSQLAEVESRELAQIEGALERMRQGKYGECEICQAKIPLARLNALPYAMTCIDCQRAAETGAAGAPGDWSRLLDNDVSYSDLETS